MVKRRRANGEGAIRQRPNGLWDARALVAGKRRSIYGKTKRQVIENLAENRTDAGRGRFVEPSRETLDGFLDYWLQAVAPQSVRPTTLANYSGHVRRYIAPRIGRTAATARHGAVINRFLADLAKEGASPCLRAAIRRTLHRALRLAVRSSASWRTP